MIVRFWGTRGSIPTPGNSTSIYGGNTSCVEIIAHKQLVILDAGSGLRELGMSLNKRSEDKAREGHLFITHTHWDHIQGFPFFEAAYSKANSFRIYGAHSATGKSLEVLFHGQMESDYFPVSLIQMAAKLEFADLQGETVDIHGVKVSYAYLNHPCSTLAYKVEYKGKSVVYATDHEPEQFFQHPQENRSPTISADYAALAKGADLLIADAQYSEDEYTRQRGWGHSTFHQAIEIAKNAGVKQLAFFHHDPKHTDDVLAKFEVEASLYAQQQGCTFKCFVAREGVEIRL